MCENPQDTSLEHKEAITYTRHMLLGYTHAGDGVYRNKKAARLCLVMNVK